MNFLSDTPKSEIIIATKEIVDDLLTRVGDDNRKKRPTHIEWLKRIICQDEYVLTNQGIGVDRAGTTIDGQHRLTALQLAGYPPVPLLIVYGLPTEARQAVDTNLTRTMADLMHFAFGRIEATSSMLAVVRFWGMYVNSDKRRIKPTPAEMAEWYRLLSPALEKVFHLMGGAKLAAPVLAAIVDPLVRHPDDERPLAFLGQVLTGANLAADAPALKLRNFLAENRGATGGKEVQSERYVKASKALTAFLEERSLKRLYGAKAGAAPRTIEAHL